MTNAGRGRAAAVALAVLAALFGLVSCGGGSAQHASDIRFRDATLPSGPHQVRVGLVEWSITLSRDTIPPGRTVLLVTNAGATTHDLAVAGGGQSRWQTRDLHPGQRARLVIQAAPGEQLRLWCTMPGHRTQGMHTTLAVRSP